MKFKPLVTFIDENGQWNPDIAHKQGNLAGFTQESNRVKITSGTGGGTNKLIVANYDLKSFYGKGLVLLADVSADCFFVSTSSYSLATSTTNFKYVGLGYQNMLFYSKYYDLDKVLINLSTAGYLNFSAAGDGATRYFYQLAVGELV